MHHVAYRSIGVTGAALGAAKKIDLTRFKDLRGPLVTLEGDRARTTGSWSRPSGTFCARECHGATCLDVMDRGARSTLDGDDGVRVDFGRSSSRGLLVMRRGNCAISIARTSSFTSTVPIRLVGRRSKLLAGRKEASTRSLPPSSTRWVGRLDSVWPQVSSTTSRRSFRCCRSSETSMRSPIAASMRTRSTRRFALPMCGPASDPSGGEPGATGSTAATIGAATEWRTSSAASNASVELRPAMTSSQPPTLPSFNSQPSLIGSLIGFANTP